MRALLLTACAAALAPCAWAGDESYTIKIKRYPAPGESAAVRQSGKKTETLKITDADGNVLKDLKYQESFEEELTETTIEKGDKAPRKFRYAFHKARIDKGKGSVAEPYEGKVVLFELVGGKYRVSLEDKGELPAEARDRLAKGADKLLQSSFHTVFLAGRTVKVGETWAVPGKKLATLPIPDIDPVRSKGEARLVKAFKKGSQQWGTFSFRATLVLRKLGPSAPGQIEGTIDTPVDGASTANRIDATVTSGFKRPGEAGKKKGAGGHDYQIKIETKSEREQER